MVVEIAKYAAPGLVLWQGETFSNSAKTPFVSPLYRWWDWEPLVAGAVECWQRLSGPDSVLSSCEVFPNGRTPAALWRESLLIDSLKIAITSSGWCGSVGWALACKPKGHWFDSQSGHMPGLQARSPVGGTQEATTHWCFSPSLSPFLPLSLKINK